MLVEKDLCFFLKLDADTNEYIAFQKFQIYILCEFHETSQQNIGHAH